MTTREIDCFSSIISRMRCYERKSITKLSCRIPKIPRESLPRSGSPDDNNRVCFVCLQSLWTYLRCKVFMLFAQGIYLLVILRLSITQTDRIPSRKENKLSSYLICCNASLRKRARILAQLSRRERCILFDVHRFGIDSRDSRFASEYKCAFQVLAVFECRSQQQRKSKKSNADANLRAGLIWLSCIKASDFTPLSRSFPFSGADKRSRNNVDYRSVLINGHLLVFTASGTRPHLFSNPLEWL